MKNLITCAMGLYGYVGGVRTRRRDVYKAVSVRTDVPYQ